MTPERPTNLGGFRRGEPQNRAGNRISKRSV
jgi:hypothetical protein